MFIAFLKPIVTKAGAVLRDGFLYVYRNPFILVLLLLVGLILSLYVSGRKQNQLDYLQPRHDSLLALSQTQFETIRTATTKVEANHETEKKNSLADSLAATRLDSAVLHNAIDSLLSVNRAYRHNANAPAARGRNLPATR
ncbi:hypothetical protein [Spirosoma sordidisoli]|uniref:Uncharacterized protein n=1 Tax=Spirosoma sordidisoli TaxID=2502893 RepID=A0A4Q2US16_9BACT|nr:hypothetical protein [Spirosoma sordidisoli]RYC70651.1 hypothetical protein EQG79_00430 [Spirosoma sordidisoli]